MSLANVSHMYSFTITAGSGRYGMMHSPCCLLCMQAEMFVDMNKGTVSSSTLFAIYIGGNDYIDTLGKGNGTVQEVLMYTEAAMDMLYEAGARV